MTTSATAAAIHGPGRANRRRASGSSSRNSASGAARITTKYFAQGKTKRRPEQNPIPHAAPPQPSIKAKPASAHNGSSTTL